MRLSVSIPALLLGAALSAFTAQPLVAAPARAASTGQTASGSAEAWCKAIGNRLSSVSTDTCLGFKLHPGKEKSTRGQPLMVGDVQPPVQKLAKADVKGDNKGEKAASRPLRILLIGGIHGDELTSASIVFKWLQWLNDSDDNRYHWRVIPVANPDGLLATPPQRMNAHGVDLNRNFPTPDWDADAHKYWESRTGRDPRRFPGASAMSEPETRWLRDQIASFRPDLVVSVHAPFGILDYDGPARQPRRFGSLNLNRLGIYPGSLGNYGGVYKNMPVITIELPHATAMPSAKEQREIWDDMLTWIRRNLGTKQLS